MFTVQVKPSLAMPGKLFLTLFRWDTINGITSRIDQVMDIFGIVAVSRIVLSEYHILQQVFQVFFRVKKQSGYISRVHPLLGDFDNHS